MDFLRNPNFNFIKWRWHAIALSTLVILRRRGVMATRGVPLGIDFSGGTLVVVRFEQPSARTPCAARWRRSRATRSFSRTATRPTTNG